MQFPDCLRDDLGDEFPDEEFDPEDIPDPPQPPPTGNPVQFIAMYDGIPRPTQAFFHLQAPAHDQAYATDGDFDMRDARARELDLGEDPGDDGNKAWWACKHEFFAASVRYPEEHDGGATGGFDRMECHSCWRHVEPLRGPTLRPRRISGGDEAEEAENQKKMGQAWSCTACGIMYCGACKEDALARKAAEEDGDEILVSGEGRW